MEATAEHQWSVELEDELCVEELARHRLTEDPLYKFLFRDIDCSYEDGVLTVLGRVPTFYLKQVLQTMLFDVDGIEHIENRVDVVSSTGLSSVRVGSPSPSSQAMVRSGPQRRLAK
jgi:hypothetical protein